MADIIAKVRYESAGKRRTNFTQNLEYISRDEQSKLDPTLEFTYQKVGEESLDSFTKYLDYLRREEVALEDGRKIKKSNVLASENGYLVLESSDEGTFNADHNKLTNEMKEQAYAMLNSAYEQGGILWKPILSFRKSFLEEVGVIIENVVDEARLKQATRLAMTEFINQNVHLGEVEWVAQLHYDKENPHVHVAMVQKNPINTLDLEKEEIKKIGRTASKSHQAMKRVALQTLEDRSQELKHLTQVMRQSLIHQVKHQEINNLYPDDTKVLLKHLKAYQYKKLTTYQQRQVDLLTTRLLNDCFSKEFQAFHKLVDIEQRRYEQRYGKSSNKDFTKMKEKDLYYRIGNQILKQLSVLKNKEQQSLNQLVQVEDKQLLSALQTIDQQINSDNSFNLKLAQPKEKNSKVIGSIKQHQDRNYFIELNRTKNSLLLTLYASARATKQLDYELQKDSAYAQRQYQKLEREINRVKYQMELDRSDDYGLSY